MRNSVLGKFLVTPRRGRFHVLFISLILLALVTPFVRGSLLGQLLFYVLLSVNLLAAVLAVSDQKRQAYVASGLLLFAFITSTWSTFYPAIAQSDLVAGTVADGAAFVAFTFTAALILKRVVAPGRDGSAHRISVSARIA